MSEKSLLNKLQLLASSLGNRLFRNNNGLAWTGSQIKKLKDGSILIKNPRPIKFGLGTGTGDLIGGTQIKIRAEHVGRIFFVFTNYEVKTKNVKATQEQKAFHNMVLSLGGISIIDKFQSDDIEGNSYVESISRF